MERLFLQPIKKKLTSLDKSSPMNYHKTLNLPLPFFLPLKFQKKFPRINMSCLKSRLPLCKQLHTNSYIVLTNAVCVLLYVTVKICKVFCLISLFILTNAGCVLLQVTVKICKVFCLKSDD